MLAWSCHFGCNDGFVPTLRQHSNSRSSGLTQIQVARELELEPSVNISMIIKRYEIRIAKDQREMEMAERASQMLNATIRP